MKNMMYLRWLHIKRQLIGLVLALGLPFLATLCFVLIFQTVKEDARIPIAIIMEEDSQLANELLHEIAENPLYLIHELEERQALNQLQRNDLDSVFIIKKGYETALAAGNRNRLIQGYASEMSLAYLSTAEMIQSIVQQQASRYKAIQEISDLHDQFNLQVEKTDEEFIIESKEIEAEQQLLQTRLDYAETKKRELVSTNTINPLAVWAYLAMLATFFLFDWVIKEKRAAATIRFLYTKVSLTTYLLQHFLLYTMVLFILDVITLVLFESLYGGVFSLGILGAIFFYRLLLNSSAFLLAFAMPKVYLYYILALTVTLLALVTSLVDLLTSSSLYLYLHPTAAFLQGEYWNLWLLLNALVIGMVWFGKGKKDVTSKTIT